MESKTIVFDGGKITVIFDRAKRQLVSIKNTNGEEVLGMFSHNQLDAII